MIEYTINIFSCGGSEHCKYFRYRIYKCDNCENRDYKCKKLVAESMKYNGHRIYNSEFSAICEAISAIENMRGGKSTKKDQGYTDDWCDLICEITIIDSNIVKQLKQLKKIVDNLANH